jgi:hypothetical protein
MSRGDGIALNGKRADTERIQSGMAKNSRKEIALLRYRTLRVMVACDSLVNGQSSLHNKS